MNHETEFEASQGLPPNVIRFPVELTQTDPADDFLGALHALFESIPDDDMTVREWIEQGRQASLPMNESATVDLVANEDLTVKQVLFFAETSEEQARISGRLYELDFHTGMTSTSFTLE